MTETAGRLLELLSLLQARRDRAGPEPARRHTSPTTGTRASTATSPGSRCTPPRMRSGRGYPAEGARSPPSARITCELRTGDDDLDWLAIRLLMLRAEVEVHEPPELREHLRALGARMVRARGPGGGSGV